MLPSGWYAIGIGATNPAMTTGTFVKGQHIITKKSKRAKRIIIKHYISFGGELSATECILLCKITKSTFYRYIQEISIEYHIPILRDESNHIILSQKEIVDKIKKGA